MGTQAVQGTHGAIEIVTVSTDRLDHAEKVWQSSLGYRRVDGGAVDDGLAHVWGTPNQAGCRWILLAPSSGTPIYVRLVEAPEQRVDWNVRRSYGWAALEITVRDVETLCSRLDEDPDFDVIGRPRPLPGVPEIYPMQAIGPSGEVLYLNEICGQPADFDLPRARSFVDHVFIVVLGAPDLDAAATFYCDRLRFTHGGVMDVPYKTINDAFDLDPDTRHRLATTKVGRSVNVEIDQYPSGAVPRPRYDGHLPPGMAMVTFVSDALDDVNLPFLAPPTVRAEAPYAGRRVAAVRGPAGEWIELVEGR